jgi:hypothetical protein
MSHETQRLFESRRLPDLPVIVGTWYNGFRFAEQGKAYSLEVHALLDAQTSPVYYILDMSRLENISFEGVMLAANQGARGNDPNLHHPMNCGTLFVSNAAIVQKVAEGMNTSTFGDLKIGIYASLDDALDVVRASI